MDLAKAAERVASSRTRRAGMGDNLEELGMSAEFGPDEGMTSTHTVLEQEDLESVDTRPSQERQCQHVRALPGQDACPDCGSQLVRLEGY